MFEFLRRVLGRPRSKEVTQRQRQRVNAQSGMRVLVVDDSSTVLATLRRMLEQNGYEVIEALDGEKGVELATADPPACGSPGIAGNPKARQQAGAYRIGEMSRCAASASGVAPGACGSTPRHGAGSAARNKSR